MKGSEEILVGVMGGGSPPEAALRDAAALGEAIAGEGWVLLCGGRAAGVMDESARAAREAGGTVVGVLPGRDLSGMSAGVTIPVVTGIGDARNLVNVLSSRVVVALPGGAGTVSEIALAVKNRRPLVVLGWPEMEPLVAAMRPARPDLVAFVATPAEAVERVRAYFAVDQGGMV